MRATLLVMLLVSVAMAGKPSTRPSVDELRPIPNEPILLSASQRRAAETPAPQAHYLYAEPTPYWSWGYGVYGWGGFYYP